MRKMDEMEMSINLKAIKWSWFITAIALFVWGVYDYIKAQTVSIASIILFMQVATHLTITYVCKRKMGNESGQKSIVYFVIGLIFFILLFGILLYFFHQ